MKEAKDRPREPRKVMHAQGGGEEELDCSTKNSRSKAKRKHEAGGRMVQLQRIDIVNLTEFRYLFKATKSVVQKRRENRMGGVGEEDLPR